MIRIPAPAALLLSLAVLACGGADDEDIPEPEAIPVPDTELVESPVPAQNAMIDPNTATRDELIALNLTAAQADALISARPHADMLAVDRALGGLSEEQRDDVYSRLWIPIDLNTASAEEIELIPGIDANMRHEFEEYRPYTSMDQFRREIGKYVDATEVARLEQYVRIN